LTAIRNLPRVLAALNKTELTVDAMRASLEEVPAKAESAVEYSAVIEIAATGAVIGMVRLESVHPTGTASLTVWIGHDQRERGCGMEACREMVRWGFEELQLETLFADVIGTNGAARSLVRRLGFEQVSTEQRGAQQVTTFHLRRQAWAATMSLGR